MLQLEYAVQYMLLMSLHNIHFSSLKEGAAAVWAFEGKVISPVQGSCYICWLAFGEKWHTSSPDLSSQALSKMKKKKWGNVSCLLSFPANSKKGGQKKAGIDTVTYQGRMWQG